MNEEYLKEAREICKFYYETPDRDDKEFDTLDWCLELLVKMTGYDPGRVSYTGN